MMRSSLFCMQDKGYYNRAISLVTEGFKFPLKTILRAKITNQLEYR